MSPRASTSVELMMLPSDDKVLVFRNPNGLSLGGAADSTADASSRRIAMARPRRSTSSACDAMPTCARPNMRTAPGSE